jgi:hypothetical protein
MKKSELRTVARTVFAERGYSIRPKKGQGYLPGSRLLAVEAGSTTEVEVAIKASLERVLSFTKQPPKRWRTLHAVDSVIAIAPAEEGDGFEVFGFPKAKLVRAFDEAWSALQQAGRTLSFESPVFVPLDKRSQKNVGHGIANLKALAEWTVRLTRKEAEARISNESEETYIDKFRRRFAKENGVDVGQVVISIMAARK